MKRALSKSGFGADSPRHKVVLGSLRWQVEHEYLCLALPTPLDSMSHLIVQCEPAKTAISIYSGSRDGFTIHSEDFPEGIFWIEKSVAELVKGLIESDPGLEESMHTQDYIYRWCKCSGFLGF
jgi:hypothetical protein